MSDDDFEIIMSDDDFEIILSDDNFEIITVHLMITLKSLQYV